MAFGPSRGGTLLIVVGHDASRTGAPRVLASFLSWARRVHPAEPVELVLLRGGPLVAEYRSIQPTHVVHGAPRVVAGWAAAGGRAVGRPALTDRLVRTADRVAVRRCRGADSVLANTLASLPAAAAAVGAGTRLVCWVHELDGVAARVLPGGPARDAAVCRVDRFLAAGPAVSDMLTDRWGVAADRVVLAEPFVDDVAVEAPSGAAPTEPDGAPLLLSVGALGYRKGIDRFVDLLACWPDGPGAPRGRWVGGDLRSTVAAEARTDIEAAGLGARVELIDTVGDAGPHLGAARVVVSVAREDPFPLTVLEAGLRGVPVVGTDAGGLGHILAAAGRPGSIVAPGDLLALRRLIDDLLADPVRARADGEALRNWVRATHLTDHLAPTVWAAVRHPGPGAGA